MNTVKRGDLFEDKCFKWIKSAIDDGQFGIVGEDIRVYPKKGYYSHKRKSEIVFDIAVEIWLKNAKNYFQLWLIECKNYSSKNVPIDDIEEFVEKIGQVAGKNVKAIMISASSFSQTVKNLAESDGVMLIESREDDYNIVLHRKGDNEVTEYEREDLIIFNLIRDALGLNKASGIDRLSAEEVEHQALLLLKDYNQAKVPIDLPKFLHYLKEKHEIQFSFDDSLISNDGSRLLGHCDIRNRIISIDRSIIGTSRFPFVLGHELGHIILHSNIRINQESYQSFQDSHYNFFADKHLLVNAKQWIEWQANQFSVALFLPKSLFIYEFITYRKKLEIRSFDHIYLDDQIINQHDFIKTINHLSKHFGISKTSVKYRINELGLLTDNCNTKRAINIARNIIEEF